MGLELAANCAQGVHVLGVRVALPTRRRPAIVRWCPTGGEQRSCPGVARSAGVRAGPGCRPGERHDAERPLREGTDQVHLSEGPGRSRTATSPRASPRRSRSPDWRRRPVLKSSSNRPRPRCSAVSSTSATRRRQRRPGAPPYRSDRQGPRASHLRRAGHLLRGDGPVQPENSLAGQVRRPAAGPHRRRRLLEDQAREARELRLLPGDRATGEMRSDRPQLGRSRWRSRGPSSRSRLPRSRQRTPAAPRDSRLCSPPCEHLRRHRRSRIPRLPPVRAPARAAVTG